MALLRTHGADLELRNEMGELPVDRVMDSTKKKAIMKLVVRARPYTPRQSCCAGMWVVLDTTVSVCTAGSV